jgi:hypothetical protein
MITTSQSANSTALHAAFSGAFGSLVAVNSAAELGRRKAGSGEAYDFYTPRGYILPPKSFRINKTVSRSSTNFVEFCRFCSPNSPFWAPRWHFWQGLVISFFAASDPSQFRIAGKIRIA